MSLLFLLLLVFVAPNASYSKSYNAESVDKLPVNNNQIKIPPFPGNGVNSYQSEVREIAERDYKRIDGRIEDEFIPYNEALEYIDTIPNGRMDTITHKDVERVRQMKMQEEDADISEYFIMRKRILAPTMKEH